MENSEDETEPTNKKSLHHTKPHFVFEIGHDILFWSRFWLTILSGLPVRGNATLLGEKSWKTSPKWTSLSSPAAQSRNWPEWWTITSRRRRKHRRLGKKRSTGRWRLYWRIFLTLSRRKRRRQLSRRKKHWIPRPSENCPRNQPRMKKRGSNKARKFWKRHSSPWTNARRRKTVLNFVVFRVGPIDRLIDWLVGWLFGRVDLLIDWIDWLVAWFQPDLRLILCVFRRQPGLSKWRGIGWWILFSHWNFAGGRRGRET